MSVPNITSIHPPNNYNVFPITGNIEILFDQEISLEHLLNSIILIGPDRLTFTGPLLNTITDETDRQLSYSNRLNTLTVKGELPVNIDIFRCDLDGNILESQISLEQDNEVCSKVIVSPKNILPESTVFTFMLGGSSTSSINAVTTRSVFDSEPDEGNSGEGLILTSGYYETETSDVLIVTVTKAGSSKTCKVSYKLESDPLNIKTLSPITGINTILNTIGLEFIGAETDDYQVGDIFYIKLEPSFCLEETYKITFSTGNDQIKELPTSVSQSPLGLNEPTEEEIEIANTPFELLSITPENGASNLSLNTHQIILVFNKNVDPLSVSNKTLKVLRSKSDGSEKDLSLVPFSWIVDEKRIIINLEREVNDE